MDLREKLPRGAKDATDEATPPRDRTIMKILRMVLREIKGRRKRVRVR